MSIFGTKRLRNCIFGTAVVFMLGMAGFTLPCSADEQSRTALSSQERFRLGERMYREGVLPSGEVMQAIVKGDITVPGTAFTCVSCHMRSGLGSYEGGVFTPPTNGAKLFKPLQVYSSPTIGAKKVFPFKPPQMLVQNQNNYKAPPPRPVYTDESLANALRDGIDSAGRTMNDTMPRYPLEKGDMALLVSYLKSLSSEFSPGVSDTTIRFATIITDDVTPEERDAMLIPLENYIKNKNQAKDRDPSMIRPTQVRSTGARSRLMSVTTYTSQGVATRKLLLSRWVLKGAPETWRSQLEEYYRKEPVFAILGGITNGDWQPIHRFCEDNQIPNLFPITDFPVISQSDWYTLYLSKGYYQEGEAAARFLNGKVESKDKPIVQIVRDTREGRALAGGFQETWREFGQKEPETIILKAGEIVTAETLQQKLVQKKPAIIIMWEGPEAFKTLDMLAAAKNRPTMVLVSSSFLGRSMLSLNEQVRDFTYMAYPYGISQTPEEKPAWKQMMVPVKDFNTEANTVATNRISQKVYSLTLILDTTLLNLRGDYYRDYFLDLVDNIMDLDVPLYERLSFGPGQRYASKGCYIVQNGKSGLVKKSGWVIH